MSPIAPALQEYFTQRLIGQRQASPHTVAAYRDCFRLLFAYMAQTSGKQPAELGFEDLDATTISGFLTHLEKANSTPSQSPLPAPLWHDREDIIQRLCGLKE